MYLQIGILESRSRSELKVVIIVLGKRDEISENYKSKYTAGE